MVMKLSGHRSAGSVMCQTIASEPAPSTRAAWNRCSGMPRIAEVKMTIPIEAPMKPLEMMMSAIGALVRRSSGRSSPTVVIRIWLRSPYSEGFTTQTQRRM